MTMFGSSDLFQDVLCPLTSNCDRPYCQFRHPPGSSHPAPLDPRMRNLRETQPTYDSASSALKNIIISQENVSATTADNCYVGYVASIEPSSAVNNNKNTETRNPSYAAAPAIPALNSYGQSFDYAGGAQGYSIYAPTSSFSYGMEHNSMFSNLHSQQSLYAPEDPVFSSFHHSSTASSVAQLPYMPYYQQSAVFNENQVALSVNSQPQQHPYKQIPTLKSALDSILPFNKTDVLANAENSATFEPVHADTSQKREKNFKFKNAASIVPSKKTALQPKNYSASHKSILQKKTQLTSVYVPTPIAELERQKLVANDRKMQYDIDKQQQIKDKERLRAVPRNHSLAVDEFSVIDRPKLPIDLADDEILNPSKRCATFPGNIKKSVLTHQSFKNKPKPATSLNGVKKFAISSTKSILKSGVAKTKLLDNKKLHLIKKLSINNDVEHNINDSGSVSSIKIIKHDNFDIDATSAAIKERKLSKDEEASAKKKKNMMALLSKGTSSIFDNVTDLDNESALFFDKANKRVVDLNRFKAKQDRLGNLNATARAIVDIDAQIAEKERALRNLISGEKSTSSTDVDWNKHRTVVKVEKRKQPDKTFDIDSLFDDVDQTLDQTCTSSKRRNTVVDDDCLIFHSSITSAKKKFEPAKTATNNSISLSSNCRTTTTTESTSKPSNLKQSPQLLQTKLLQKKFNRIPTPAEQMRSRFESKANSDSFNGPKYSLRNFDNKTNETSDDNDLIFPTPEKDKQLAPLDIYNKKVAYSVRVKYLQKIYDEYKKINVSNNEAIDKSIGDEKLIIDKILSRTAYASAIANSIRRIRDKGNSEIVGCISVSHQNVLAGKHVGKFSIGVHRAEKNAARNIRLNKAQFYDILHDNFLLNERELNENGFPRWENRQLRKLVNIQAYNPSSVKRGFVDNASLSRVCSRCGANYCLTKSGDYLAQDNSCVYHWGKAWKRRVDGALELHYTCCDQDPNVKGCVVGEFHVTETLRRQVLSDFIETPQPRSFNSSYSRKVYAVDCEMVYGVWGPMLGRVSIVDMADALVFDEIVKPQHKVIDPNTRFSGLTVEDLKNAKYTFKEVRERLLKLINAETILIGHSLESDLKTLRIVHNKVVDTSVVFPHRLGFPKKRALKTITLEILQKIIQEDASGHDSKEDASACMKIMLHKVEHMF